MSRKGTRIPDTYPCQVSTPHPPHRWEPWIGNDDADDVPCPGVKVTAEVCDAIIGAVVEHAEAYYEGRVIPDTATTILSALGLERE